MPAWPAEKSRLLTRDGQRRLRADFRLDGTVGIAGPGREPSLRPRAHRTEQTTLYRLVQQRAARFIAHTEVNTGSELPLFIEDDFDAVLKCGILAHGFVRLRCGEGDNDKPRAYLCKRRRGFFPSGGARWMSQTAAHLVDHVIAPVPVRRWVSPLPIALRLSLAAQPELVTPVRQVMQRVVARHRLAGAQLKAHEGRGGAVTLIRRFGSAASLNVPAPGNVDVSGLNGAFGPTSLPLVQGVRLRVLG